MNIATISNYVGIIGVIITLFAYYFLSVGIWEGEGVKYQLSNLTGSILVLFSLFFHTNVSSMIIEIAWIVISVIGLLRIRKFKV